MIQMSTRITDNSEFRQGDSLFVEAGGRKHSKYGFDTNYIQAFGFVHSVLRVRTGLVFMWASIYLRLE